MAGTSLDINTPVYQASDQRKLSMADLLEFFSRHGTMRVSDLHLKVGMPPMYRIDGDLQAMKGKPLDARTVETLARIVVAEPEWDILQDNRAIDSSYISEKHQFRMNIFHDNDGLAMAVRALDDAPPPLEQIGFPNGVWRDVIDRKQGLVLVTGITGAGKSTTIASLINTIAHTRACRIITLEDPVEYVFESDTALISQREVGRDVPNFETGVRDALREDPDVIFVGEMRDRDSTAWTLTAAETGHLVFSTLHTRDVRGTITRILDMFSDKQQDEVAGQLSLGLSHIICQKLVPKADGSGRVAAMEILNNTFAIANLIRTRKLEQIYSHLQTRTRDTPAERMISLEYSLADLVMEGEITPAEAERWANHPSELTSLIQSRR